jgi:hypothetical protein
MKNMNELLRTECTSYKRNADNKSVNCLLTKRAFVQSNILSIVSRKQFPWYGTGTACQPHANLNCKSFKNVETALVSYMAISISLNIVGTPVHSRFGT